MPATTTSLDRRVELLRRLRTLSPARTYAESLILNEAERELDHADEYAGAIRPGMSLAARAFYETMIDDAVDIGEALLVAVQVLRGEGK